MVKLCQINALVTGRKGEVEKEVGDVYKLVQKPDLFEGMTRTYRPYDEEEGEKLPSESKRVQASVRDLIERATAKWTDLWDLTFTQDSGNQSASADIVVDGVTVLKAVPVTSLLFLEKQVNDVETFVSKLPTPDPAEDWSHDPNTGMLRSGTRESTRSKKEPSHYEKSAATKEHPAQVEFFYRDVGVGVWSQVRFSGTIPADRKSNVLARVKKFKDAIKLAREQANSIEVERKKAGEAIFEFLLGHNG